MTSKLEWHPDTKKNVTWDEAKAYCESLGDGWRMPTIQELTSVVDYSRYDPATEIAGFECLGYWSASTYALNPHFAWFVFLFVGNVSARDRPSSSLAVRAVRGSEVSDD